MGKLKTFLTILLIMVLSAASYAAGDAETIAKIEVTGNERVDTGFIMNAVKMKENMPYNLDKIREDMKNIYKTGFFSDVQIDVRDSEKGKIVTFIVVERPPIKAIYIFGKSKDQNSQSRRKTEDTIEYGPEHGQDQRKYR